MVQVPVIGTCLHITVRVILSYLLAGRMGLRAVALATGIGWMFVVAYHSSVYRRLRKREMCIRDSSCPAKRWKPLPGAPARPSP